MCDNYLLETGHERKKIPYFKLILKLYNCIYKMPPNSYITLFLH